MIGCVGDGVYKFGGLDITLCQVVEDWKFPRVRTYDKVFKAH